MKIFQTVTDCLGERLGVKYEQLQKIVDSESLEGTDEDSEEIELSVEPTGEDSDDESPYGIEDRDLEAALSANDMKIKETQDEWTLEEQSLEEKTLTSE